MAMTLTSTVQRLALISVKANKYNQFFHAFLFGALLPLSFAPFHIPGAAILGIALFYAQLGRGQSRYALFNGLFFGLGYFGFGTSWVFVSIHEYGHLNSFISALITLIFLLYLALFPAFMSFIYRKLVNDRILWFFLSTV